MDNGINRAPATIEQLQAWYIAHNLPPEEITRFFIGKNVQEPRAFGIYRDGNLFIVYKNKADGSRAVRYSGFDESFAVSEIYEKLKLEISSQKSVNTVKAPLTAEQKRRQRRSMCIFLLVAALAIVWLVWSVRNTPSRGYYHTDDAWYYYCDGWYVYDEYYGAWYVYDSAYDNDYWSDYYYSESYPSGYGLYDFEYTDYYRDVDTDSSWSSNDSWDSDFTDWDSDW